MSTQDKKVTITEADDDLDELLDDVLENFSTLTTSTSSSSSTSKAPDTTNASAPLPDTLPNDLGTDEYAKRFATQMEEFVKGLENNEEFRQTFEELLGNVDPEFSEPPETTDHTTKSFQERINQTINKLQKSSEQVDAEVSEEANEEFLAEMIKQMESLADNGEFQNILEGMMEKLTSKDILYEPIKDLAQKYPQWLKENENKTSREEFQRYQKQSEYVQKIVAHYEAADYDENDEEQNKTIVDLMQKLQDFGQPPAEILADLTPEMELDEQGLPKISPSDLEKCHLM